MSFDLHNALAKGESERLEFKASFNLNKKYGSGFRRIRSAIAEYPTMQFSYRESGDGFITELAYREQKITTTPKHEAPPPNHPPNYPPNYPPNHRGGNEASAIAERTPGVLEQYVGKRNFHRS